MAAHFAKQTYNTFSETHAETYTLSALAAWASVYKAGQ